MQGPEIRTGFLKDGQPIKLTTGKEITITTDYEAKGHEDLIAMRYMTQRSKIPTHFSERCSRRPGPYATCAFLINAGCCEDALPVLVSLLSKSLLALGYRESSENPCLGSGWRACSWSVYVQLQEAASGHEGWLSDLVRGWIHCHGGHQHRPQGRHRQGQVPQQCHSWVRAQFS